jgi:hypothetical protein
MTEEQEASRLPTYVLTVAGRVKATDADDEGIERLRAHLGAILRLKSLVVLMGAGASFHIGGPEIRQSSIQRIRELVIQAESSLTSEDERLIAIFCPSPQFNLEALLEHINATMAFASSTRQTAVLIGESQQVSVEELATLRAKLNVALVSACNLELNTKCANPWEAHQAFFRKLLSVRRDQSGTRIFTTNYDLAIEYALDEAGIDYIDGFKGSVRRSFHPEVYNQLMYTETAADYRRFLPVSSLLYTYKLHGSINWRTAGGSNDRNVIQVSPSSKPTKDDLALVYPTQDKESSALGFPYADLLRAFNDVLLSPEVGLLTIGYGFGDAHINRIIDAALDSNYTMQLLVVDPKAVTNIGDAESEHAIEFTNNPVGRYASANDARRGGLLGAGATFEAFATNMMPDLDAEDVAENKIATKRARDEFRK